MLFGKRINKYYLKYAPMLLLGIVALVVVDYLQLIVPELYRTVVNGLNDGTITEASGRLRHLTWTICLTRCACRL